MCRIVPRQLPSAHRVAILVNAEDRFWKQVQEQVQLAGRNAGIEIAPSVMVRGSSEIDAAFAAMKKKEAGAVVVHGSLATKNVAEIALKRGLTAATQTRSFAEVGGLMSYGADGPDIFGRQRSSWPRPCRAATPQISRLSNRPNSN